MRRGPINKPDASIPLRASTRFCLISLAWSKLQRTRCECFKLQQKENLAQTWPVPVSWFPKLPVCYARPSPLVSLHCWYSPRYRNHLMSFQRPLGLRMLKEEYNCSVSEIMTWPGQECRGWLKHDNDMSLVFQWVLKFWRRQFCLHKTSSDKNAAREK